MDTHTKCVQVSVLMVVSYMISGRYINLLIIFVMIVQQSNQQTDPCHFYTNLFNFLIYSSNIHYTHHSPYTQHRAEAYHTTHSRHKKKLWIIFMTKNLIMYGNEFRITNCVHFGYTTVEFCQNLLIKIFHLNYLERLVVRKGVRYEFVFINSWKRRSVGKLLVLVQVKAH